ncbi:PAAR domain-containing protein [Paraburkholderia sediminicola]|uniref:PAAR domain-containing protein n=1 Tax=Paraburkholderia TaxID=1822464 RepID=UPI000E7446B5|nr:PAAR domain-containing protein [Paraburkholderia phytofirmans]
MPEQKENQTTYLFATIGARTERGGRVSTGSTFHLAGLPVATVGCVVTYRDGSEAVITDGAGFAFVIADRPAAIVGSSLSNGDRIIETLWSELDAGVTVKDGEKIAGLFDPAWTPPPRKPVARFATRGATTARGGVVLEASSAWEVGETQRYAASIGDFVQYQDGSRARIITGVGIPGNANHAYAVVGSLLDNGDVITDSPHREPRTSTTFVPLDEHRVALTRQ